MLSKVLSVVAVCCFSGSVFAQQACDLEGMGSVEVRCENPEQKILFKAEGGGGSIGDIEVKFGKNVYKTAPEDLPAASFERVDEQVFSLYSQTKTGGASLMGIPRTFQVKSERVYRPNAMTYSGTFKALLFVTTVKPEATLTDTLVTCTFQVLDCPRTKLNVK